MALCADCKLRIRSSVVINVVPKLPWHPGFRGLHPDWIALTRLRSRFDTAASTPGSNNSVSTIWMVSGWLRESGTFQVSRFAVQSFADIYMLDLDVYRRDLDAAASMHGSNDPIQMFRVVLWWLRDSGASQPHCFDSRRVNAVAASHAVSVTTVSVTSVWIAIAIIIASCLALDTWRNRLSSPLEPSELERSAQRFYRALGRFNFGHIHCLCLCLNTVAVHMHGQPFRKVSMSFDVACTPTHASNAYVQYFTAVWILRLD
ncbi:hypothetical protein SCLCIDRAFT_21846 [Scleroderma citrinum Foug A]|uniref:Uncharacterized protein n=1 Tax=Scleroderma citrinum Foug A TaxID=1036808 RepID=A0A0C2ZZ41_9AGAM|nr:hypothetical protein SCLCIDRAFT_21846 [Scleroderma citrinum Foug A]